jgi:UDP-2-acetamido-3-amino-2,3-dideoxy-glucuronate N-acetyltransferase
VRRAGGARLVVTPGDVQVHPTAEVDARAVIGAGSQVWNWTKVREGARIGRGCRLGQAVYIDHGVVVGDGCKIQNGVSVYHGVSLGDHVFVGPNATFTNDLVPRAASGSFAVVPTVVEDHVSVGANATVVCGVRLGRACMVGAGAVVVRDVPAGALVVGNPARVLDFVTLDGRRRFVGAAGATGEETP